MAHVGMNRLAGETQRVRLLLDQRVRGVELKRGDTCDLPQHEALHLKNIKRVEFVDAVAESGGAPIKATR